MSTCLILFNLVIFTMEPVLVIPNIDKVLKIEVDVSDYMTGGVL